MEATLKTNSFVSRVLFSMWFFCYIAWICFAVIKQAANGSPADKEYSFGMETLLHSKTKNRCVTFKESQ